MNKHAFLSPAIAFVATLLIPPVLRAENEIGFIEKFALAADREKVLAELVPGTEEHYFFHALHWQNTRDEAKLAAVLDQWKRRFPTSEKRAVIENREALLGYDASPQKTLAFLKERLGLQFNHQQEARDQRPDLPSALEPARVGREVFEKDALANDRGMGSFSQAALELLVRGKPLLTEQQRRGLLQRIERPDVPGLVDMVAADLKTVESRGFGEFPIHRALLAEQLDALARLVPALNVNQAFVFAKLRKLSPSADEDVEFDGVAREAWLERAWGYVKTLPPAFNTLKAHVLYRRLDHDRRKGVYDRDRLLEYLKLPRAAAYVNPKWIEAEQTRQPLCDANADLREAMPDHRPFGNDEPLVRDYLLHLFSASAPAAADAMLAPWVNFVRDTWLKPVLAEAMITAGAVDAEQWASLLTPQAFQALKERVDIEFPATNIEFFQPPKAGAQGEEVRIDVVLKNTPKLIVKIYELNTLNFFLTQKRQLNTDLNLDGLVANSEETHAFDAGPFKRMRQTFQFPALRGKRGAWIIEFIGGGRSTRALVRTGQWQVIQSTGPSGEILTVLDEQGVQVKDAAVWLDGRKFTADEKLGRVVVPFTQQPGRRQLVLASADGAFATLAQFDHHAEEYRLDAQFHIAREQLVARQNATLAARVSLLLGETHLDPALLGETLLKIQATTHDGISTTLEFKGVKPGATGVLTQEITIPERLAKLTVTFSGKVEVLSAGGERREVSASRTWELNGIEKTEATNDGHLSRFGDRYAFELLGRNGEAVADQQVIFTFRHREFTRTQTIALKTDAAGRIALGPLDGIASVAARIPNGRHPSWALADFDRTWPSTLHAKVGDVIRIPVRAAMQKPVAFLVPDAAAARSWVAREVSLLALRAGTFTRDESSKALLDGAFLAIQGLPPGDYALRLRSEARDIAIKVTDGRPAHGWFLGGVRNLQSRNSAPLQIADIVTADDAITVKLANVSPFARVHVAASRFDPGRGIFADFGGFARFGVASAMPARLPNLYSAGREIGDEYRYILERRYAKIFPGNMLARPGLLLNPWDKRATDIADIAQQAGQAASDTRGERAAVAAASAPEPTAAPKSSPSMDAPGANFDVLATGCAALYNHIPDKDGVVRIDRKVLGDRQHVQIHAEDLTNAVWRSFALPELPVLSRDLRLARNLDPARPFTQKKTITVVQPGRTFTLADILTSEFETYDSLAGIFSLLTTLHSDATLAKFAWVTGWPALKDEEKRAKYSEFACHELNFFLAKKDAEFFAKVVKPYLANKKDRTFMDDFLLGNDLATYLQPWSYARLNIVERVLLAQRVDGEAPRTARHLRELWEMNPVSPATLDAFFETALRGRALGQSDGAKSAFQQEKAKAQSATEAKGDARKRIALAGAMSRASREEEKAVLEQSTRRLKDAEVAKDLAVGEAQKQLAQRNGALTNANGFAMAEGRYGTMIWDRKAGFDEDFVGKEAAEELRKSVRAYYRQLGPTKEWAESNYYRRPIQEQDASLVTVNAFWRDYSAWVAEGSKGTFVSPNIAESSRSFTEMMLALAVLDLPFDAPKHTTKAADGQFHFTAAGPVIVYHKEIEAGAANAAGQQLLVSQSFFRQGDRFRQEGPEKVEKYVTGEFLTGTVYGANVVVTNPTSSPVKADVLLQIPKGALPVSGSKATQLRQVQLAQYTTQTFEYFFYFPETAGEGKKFPHFPVSAAVKGAVAGAAKPFEFNVVAKLTQVDKASWDYVSQYGSDAEVFAFLEQNNIEALNIERVAWRCRQSVDFFRRLVAVLQQRHVWNEPVYRYAIQHNDASALREWLRHHAFLSNCGEYLASRLVTIDPVERRTWEHLEYSPLVNQRAHRLGGERRIANPALLAQYQSFLSILSQKAAPDAMDALGVVYHLFLQDRTEEALTRLRAVDASKLPTRIQHDYLRCYADFYEGNLAAARGIAARYAGHPITRWRNLFADVSAQLDEIEGKAVATKPDEKNDREQQQSALAATEPAFDFKVENRAIALTCKNLGEVTVNYYLMDPEFSFSSSPFVSQDASRFSIIKPNRSERQALPPGRDTLDIALPGEFTKANVLVEIVGAGQRKAQTYHANTLKLTLAENYGRIETRDSGTDKPIPRAYVKVYARLKGGTVRFFKDGYTDLRGRFDYASLNAPENPRPVPLSREAAPVNGLDWQMLKPAELDNVERLSILVLSESNGTAVREVSPPRD